MQIVLIPCSWNNKDLGIQDKKMSVYGQIIVREIQKYKSLLKQVNMYVDPKDTLKYITRHIRW